MELNSFFGLEIRLMAKSRNYKNKNRFHLKFENLNCSLFHSSYRDIYCVPDDSIENSYIKTNLFFYVSVCKKWNMLSHLSWNHFKKLDLDFNTWMFDTKNPKLSLHQTTIDRVLKLSGRYLVTIDLTDAFEETFVRFEGLHSSTFRNICQSCPNMQELTFMPDSIFPNHKKCKTECHNSCHKLVPWLMPHRDRLTKLHIKTEDSCDSKQAFMLLFANMKNLKSFMVTRQEWVENSDILLKLPLQELEEIIFDFLYLNSNQSILDFVSIYYIYKHSKRESFSLNLNL